MDELRERGGDVDHLALLARGDRAALGEALKALGYTKMGMRKKLENELVAYEPAVSPNAPAAPVAPAPAAAAAAPRPAPAPAAAAPAAAAAPEPQGDQALGTAAFRAGRHDEAEAFWKKALLANPHDAALHSNLSAVRLLLGRAEEALEDAGKAIEQRPGWGKAHGRRGAALAALGCHADAVEAYERGVKLSPDNTHMLAELGHQKRLLQERAEAAAAAAAAADGGSASASDANPPPAASMAPEPEPAPATAPAGAPAETPGQGVSVDRRGNAVETLGAEGGAGGAKYTRVADTDTLMAQGAQAFKAGEHEKAEALYTAALKRRPADARILSNRSASRLAMAEFTAALEDAVAAVEARPDWARAHGRQGAALAGLGRLDEALGCFRKGLELEPGSEHFASEIKRVISEKEIAEKARGAASGESHVALTGLELAKQCVKLGRPEQAVRELDKLITNQVDDAELYCERSIAHADSSRFALAHEDASTAVYLYKQQEDPEIKPWEDIKDLKFTPMTRQEKNALARSQGRSFLLRGHAEVRLCDYDAAMHTFQQGCKADARLGPEAHKELREQWYATKELCRGWRRAGKMRKKTQKANAFRAERQPVLADIAKFVQPSDKALALKNLASIHTKWGMHEDAITLYTAALAETPDDMQVRDRG